MLFSHEDWVRAHIKMTLLGIELGTLEVKGEWSDHYTTEAPNGTDGTDMYMVRMRPRYAYRAVPGPISHDQPNFE